MARPERVLIVGGGVGGLAVAAALRKVGVAATLFEQAPRLREVGAGVGLWSNALASLDQLGAGDDVRGACTPLRVLAAATPDGRTLTQTDLDQLGPDFARAACRVIPRPALLAALAGKVPSDIVRTGARVVSAAAAEKDADQVHVHLEGGGSEAGDLLVGADGLHSVVRPLVVGKDRVRYSGQTCFRGIAEMAPPDAGVLREIQGRGQRGSVLPIDDRTVYWWVAHNAPANQILAPEARKAALLQRYGGWPFGLGQAIAATAPEDILQNDLVDRRPATRYVRGRVVLVGDAAHPTTPNLGQGVNMAIDDAIVLARALRDEATVAQALARYQRERIGRTRSIVNRSWSFGRLCRWRSSAGVALREAMVRLTPARIMTGVLRWQILDQVGPL